MTKTHWADSAINFKIQDAACLMAGGVSLPKELVAWADHLPPEARYFFEQLWTAYMQGMGVYPQPAPDSPDYPKMLHAKDFREPLINPKLIIESEPFVAPEPGRWGMRRPAQLGPTSADESIKLLGRIHITSDERQRDTDEAIKSLGRVRIPREELHRWVQAMGIESAYSFAPKQADIKPLAPAEPASATEAVQGAPVVVEPDPLKPVQRSAVQDTAILDAIRATGHNPLALPKNQPGKPGIKKMVRGSLVGKHPVFPQDGKQFDKAWERLRSLSEIVDRG